MEVITITSDAYKALVNKIDSINEVVNKMKYIDTPLNERWLDIQEACFALKVSKRTLQAYRDKQVLPYSKFEGKIYFKVADIEKHLEKHYIKVGGAA